MKKLREIAWIAAAGALFAVLPRMAAATVAETVREDLRPVSGHVLQRQENGYLVDLDDRHGVRVGDLLSVVAKGKEIVHPLTNKVIGRLDESKAVLRITQVRSGFSVAHPVSEPAEIAAGDLVRRFALLTAVFRGPAGPGRPLYEELRQALPELEWQGLFLPGEQSGREADLTFALEDSALRLLGRDGKQLRAWAVPETAVPAGGAPARADASPPAQMEAVPPSPSPVPPSGGAASSPVDWQTGGVRFGPFTSMGELPNRVLMSAFFRDGDSLLLAAADDERVRLYSVSGGLRQLAVREMGGGAHAPIYVAWWKPEKTGPLYLAVTAAEEVTRGYGTMVETNLSSVVYELDGGSFKEAATGLRYFLGTFDRDGDGVPETLLGQELNRRDKFGRPFLLERKGGKISAGKPGFPLPLDFTVPGSAMADLTGDGRPEIAFVRNGILWVYSGSDRVYESAKEMGGSLATLTYDREPEIRDSMISTISLEVPPFPRDLDGDGAPELLVAASDAGSVKVPGIGPGVNKSWVDVVKYRDGSFQKGRVSGDLDIPIQGLWSDGERILLVGSRTTSGLTKKGSSTLYLRPLR